MLSDPGYFSTRIYLCQNGSLSCPLNMPNIFSSFGLGIGWYLCLYFFHSRDLLEPFPLVHQMPPSQKEATPDHPIWKLPLPLSTHILSPNFVFLCTKTNYILIYLSIVHLPSLEDKLHEDRKYILFTAICQHSEQCLKLYIHAIIICWIDECILVA